jgi:hypothetical protein
LHQFKSDLDKYKGKIESVTDLEIWGVSESFYITPKYNTMFTVYRWEGSPIENPTEIKLPQVGVPYKKKEYSEKPTNYSIHPFLESLKKYNFVK